MSEYKVATPQYYIDEANGFERQMCAQLTALTENANHIRPEDITLLYTPLFLNCAIAAVHALFALAAHVCAAQGALERIADAQQ